PVKPAPADMDLRDEIQKVALDWPAYGSRRITAELKARGWDVNRKRVQRIMRVLQVFYSVRSERLLMEQLDYNLLFRWFVGLEIDEPVWNHAVFSKNRDRLLNQEIAQQFFATVKGKAQGLMSDEHFTVDGTLIEAWASHKSFQRKDSDEKPGAGGSVNFHGEQRTNDTHGAKTDPES